MRGQPHPNPPRKQGGNNLSTVYGGDKEGEIDPSDSLFVGIGKSIVQGVTAFPRTFWGAGAMMEDIAKNIPQAIPLAAFTQIVPEDFFKRRYEDVKGVEERFQAKGEGYKKYVNGAIRTMSEMLSQFAGTAGIGTLPSMSAGAGIDKYLESRKEGYSIPRSFAAGGVTATTEYVTEKTPLEILGRPGLKFVDRLMKGLVADVSGELEATLVEMTTIDQAILGKSHTRQEYLEALLDTAATAALTTFGATGVTHPFVAGTRSPASPTEQAQQTPEAQTAQQTPEIKQSAKEEVPGVKLGEYATTSKPQLESKATLSDEEMDTIREKIKSPEVVSFVETYKGYLEKEPERVSENHKEVFFKEFGLEGKDKVAVKTPIEEITIMPKHYEKLEKHADVSRKEYVKYIKPTLENPNEIREFEDEHIYIKAFKDGKVKLHTTIVVVKKDGTFYTTNVPLSNVNKWEKAIKKGNLLYSVAQKPAKEVAPSSPGNNIISPPPESVKPIAGKESIIAQIKEDLQRGQAIQQPNIQLMPSLKGLVDTGKLSIEDALEIDDVARQNNWSDDTVKQFHKSAVEGLGIQNVETQSLASLLITAKIKASVYKQNAEQYKQELAETESQIERLSKLLKIEGGAPDKYETAANDFIKNLGDLKNLKPEEIIQKAQEEFALNLNRLDTGMDVKTLIAAAVKTINEAEGISKETVTHEQTINEALKELPGIYNKVMNLKRGKPLTRQQQLAAVGWVE